MRSLDMALPLLASGCLAAQAGEPERYDLQGGQNLGTTVTAYLATDADAVDMDGNKIDLKKAELVLDRSRFPDPALDLSLKELIASGHGYVRQDARGQVRLQVGCVTEDGENGLHIVNADQNFRIQYEPALLRSDKEHPVNIFVEFVSTEAGNSGSGDPCASLPDALTVR